MNAERAAAAAAARGQGRTGHRRLSAGMQRLSTSVRRLSTTTGLAGRRSSLPLSRPQKESVAAGRSLEALRGIQLLKEGCPAVKISQRGKVRQTIFKLSEDEATSVMAEASSSWMARCGTWEKAVAQHVYDGLRQAGLSVVMTPAVEDADGSERLERLGTMAKTVLSHLQGRLSAAAEQADASLSGEQRRQLGSASGGLSWVAWD